MNSKIKKNGFTLVELLAVTIILIIIIFIAITKVGDSNKKAQLNAITSNAGSYIKAINNAASTEDVTLESDYDNGFLIVTDLNKKINISGKKPSSGYAVMSNYEVSTACLQYDSFKIEYSNGELSKPESGKCEGLKLEYAYEYTGNYETLNVLASGPYKIQVWGAQGGYRTTAANGGMGGYSEGIINLNSGDILYIYVGGSGNTGGPSGGFNGGGSKTTYPGGGGATDVRVEGTTLYHRIIVAGGGGSDGSAGYSGKAGGGLTGITATETGYCSGGEGATQTTAGLRGEFGQGGSGAYNSAGWGGGGFGGAGGGGWYGGGGVDPDRSDDDRGGGGGSGFIYTGTNEVPVEYAVKKHAFTEGITLDGTSADIPTHDGKDYMTGNAGDGFAKITFVGEI